MANNPLEKVLSVFDQSRQDEQDPHILHFEDDEFSDDEDIQYILNRLKEAASDPKIRQEMKEEDEYYAAMKAQRNKAN